MMGLELVLCPPRPVAIGRGTYTALPLRVRDLLELGRGERGRRDAAIRPYRALLLYEPDESHRRRWVREALEAIEAADEAGPVAWTREAADAWASSYLARVLRRSAPLPKLTPSAEEWAEVLAIGQGLDPLDEVYSLVDGPPDDDDGARPWPAVYCELAREYGLTPAAFGDLMLPQLRVLTSGGTHEPGAPLGDEHDARAAFRRRDEFLNG